MLSEKELNNSFIKEWLSYCGGGETPFIMSLWTGLSGIAACLGRRSTLKVGRLVFYPNMYILLIGPSAVRKSTASDLMQGVISKYTDIKFGPTDTAGKKQGIITSFFNHYEKPRLQEELNEAGLSDSIFNEISNESKINDAFSKARKKVKEKKPPSELYIVADELINLIGQNQVEMIGMLTEIYNPKDKYEYALSKESKYIYKPCLNLIGCATPTGLATHLPPSSIGHGFSSRVIMVYEGKPSAPVYPVPDLDETKGELLGNTLAEVSNLSQEFNIAEDCVALIAKLYKEFKPDINDSRFLAYEARRLDHLHKVAMLLAAGEMRTTIEKIDIIDAHRILCETEKTMAQSLGEIGLDKLSLAKQRFKEMLDNSWPMGVTVSAIKADMLRDMSGRDFEETVNEFITRGYCVRESKKQSTQKGTIQIDMLIPPMPKEKAQTSTSMEMLDQMLAEETFKSME